MGSADGGGCNESHARDRIVLLLASIPLPSPPGTTHGDHAVMFQVIRVAKPSNRIVRTMAKEIKRIEVGSRLSEVAIYNGVAYLGGE